MVRRSTPQRIVDDRAFPIRVSIVTPWNGFGQRIDVYVAWMKPHLPDGCAWHAGHIYFQNLALAGQFFSNFPEVQMADHTATREHPGRPSSATGLKITGSMP